MAVELVSGCNSCWPRRSFVTARESRKAQSKPVAASTTLWKPQPQHSARGASRIQIEPVLPTVKLEGCRADSVGLLDSASRQVLASTCPARRHARTCPVAGNWDAERRLESSHRESALKPTLRRYKTEGVVTRDSGAHLKAARPRRANFPKWGRPLTPNRLPLPLIHFFLSPSIPRSSTRRQRVEAMTLSDGIFGLCRRPCIACLAAAHHSWAIRSPGAPPDGVAGGLTRTRAKPSTSCRSRTGICAGRGGSLRGCSNSSSPALFTSRLKRTRGVVA